MRILFWLGGRKVLLSYKTQRSWIGKTDKFDLNNIKTFCTRHLNNYKSEIFWERVNIQDLWRTCCALWLKFSSPGSFLNGLIPHVLHISVQRETFPDYPYKMAFLTLSILLPTLFFYRYLHLMYSCLLTAPLMLNRV